MTETGGSDRFMPSISAGFDSSNYNILPSVTQFGRKRSSRDDIHLDRKRSRILKLQVSKDFSLKTFLKMEARFGLSWKTVSEYYLHFQRPKGAEDGNMHFPVYFRDVYEFDDPERIGRKPSRALLFHVASMLDVNYCGLHFLRCTNYSKEDYVSI